MRRSSDEREDRPNRQTTLTYDVDDNATPLALPNGVKEGMTFNGAGQLTSLAATNSSNATLNSFAYNYTNPANSQPTAIPYSVTDATGANTAYTYDNSNSVTQAVQKNSGGTTLNSYGFGYDPVGNLSSKTINGTGTTFTYNAADQLTQASGGMSRTYTYDGNGDRTSSSDGTSISVNAAGQLSSITPPGHAAIAMTYTGIGEQQRTGAGSSTYQYDGSGLSRQTDSVGNTYFTTMPDGAVISETIPSGTSAGTYYYLSDGAGSVAALTDSTGAVKNTYSYDPLGNTTSSGSVPNPFTYQGGMYDSSTQTYYTGSGYYDPATGQSFGCKDNGPIDPGEDRCGEDENAGCGGVCSSARDSLPSGATTPGLFFSDLAKRTKQKGHVTVVVGPGMLMLGMSWRIVTLDWIPKGTIRISSELYHNGELVSGPQEHPCFRVSLCETPTYTHWTLDLSGVWEVRGDVCGPAGCVAFRKTWAVNEMG